MGLGLASIPNPHSNACRYGVKYPALYAAKGDCAKEEHVKAFNCVQRGHQNSLELQPAFLSLLTLAGLRVRSDC
jgi:glutathione S-transferase